jgi:hypothetical protein
MSSLPVGLAAQHWPTILSGIKRNCQHANKQNNTPDNRQVVVVSNQQNILPPPQPIVMTPPEIPTEFTIPPVVNNKGNGPGAFLKKYLSRIGIHAAPNCSCNARAAFMDQMGPDWCEQNLDEIVSWLREEAEKRRLPFIDWPARMLVMRAISSARKAIANEDPQESDNPAS